MHGYTCTHIMLCLFSKSMTTVSSVDWNFMPTTFFVADHDISRSMVIQNIKVNTKLTVILNLKYTEASSLANIRSIHAYELLRCLYLNIWHFFGLMTILMTTRPITSPLAHMHGVMKSPVWGNFCKKYMVKDYAHSIHHYTKIIVVRACVRLYEPEVTGSDSTRAYKFSF